MSATTRSATRRIGSQAISYTTGVPAMCSTLMLLTGKWTARASTPWKKFDPDPYLDALDKYGLPRSEPGPLWWTDAAGSIRARPFAGLANLSEGALASCPPLLSAGQKPSCRAKSCWGPAADQAAGSCWRRKLSQLRPLPASRPCLAGTGPAALREPSGQEEAARGRHVFCAAYRVDQFNELLDYADHIVFQLSAQLAKFKPCGQGGGQERRSAHQPGRPTQEGHAIYDPCAPGSRLGTTRAQWDAALAKQPGLAALLDGLHFHTLCEQDADALAVTLDAVEEKFGDLLPGLKWLNFGGGHHITRPGYDLAALEACIARMQEKYGVQIYLEPGEAWALNAGYLVTTVLDTLQNGDTSLAVLDMSAACHTPDVIEMPYRPPLLDAGEPGEKPCTIRLGGPTCLAGDVVGDYSFDAPLAEGDRLIFGDMAIYTTCKNNTFNGMPLPPIWALAEDGTCRELVRFGYNDFKMRLGHRA